VSSQLCKVKEMADFDINSFIEGQYEEFESLNEDISKEEDLLMEQILNI